MLSTSMARRDAQAQIDDRSKEREPPKKGLSGRTRVFSHPAAGSVFIPKLAEPAY